MNRSSFLVDILTVPHSSSRSIKMKISAELAKVLTEQGSSIISTLENKTEAEITLFNENNDSYLRITAKEKSIKDLRETTIKIIDTISCVPLPETVYNGTVVDVSPIGALVEILPGVIGLLPVFELSWDKISSPRDVLNSGDQIQVKLLDMDLSENKFRFSQKI